MLPELTLDTVTFARLAERARARIPALSRRAWTDHNLHDPGITLIELYAYLLEQRAYWLDRVTPPLDRALLTLLGVTPERARPARTAVSADAPAHSVLAAGTELPFAGAGSLTFTTDEAIAVVAHRPERLEVRTSMTGAHTRRVDLRSGRTIVVLPNGGGPGQLDLLLRLTAPWNPRPEPVTLLLELRSPVDPEWHPDAAPAPPPMRLEFLVRGPAGVGPAPRVADGTGGLRRSGVVRLWVGDWRPEPDGSYLIRIRTDAATATVPVRLARVTVNATLARHRVRRRHVVAESWPPLPGRSIELSDENGPPLSGSVTLRMRESTDSGWRRWREVGDLTSQLPGARVFAVNRTLLRFGDGRAGRQPVLAASGDRIRVEYWAGGGTAGNIPAGATFDHPAFAVRSLVDAAGGRGDEPLEEARARAARLQRRIGRAVTAGDIESLAETTPGVAIARGIAVPGLDEALPLAVPGTTTVYLIPSAPRDEPESDLVEPVRVLDPMPDPGALSAVHARLEQARLLGSTILVRPPRWRDVRLTVQLGSPVALAPEAEATVRAALERHLDALVGGDEERGWPLGGAIDPSALLRRIQGLVGEATRVEEIAVEVGGDEPESCRPVAIGPCHLPRLVAVTVVGRRRADAGGGLK